MRTDLCISDLTRITISTIHIDSMNFKAQSWLASGKTSGIGQLDCLLQRYTTDKVDRCGGKYVEELAIRFSCDSHIFLR